LNEYYKDIKKDKAFKVIKSVFVEAATTPDYAMAEASWILKAADPEILNAVVQMPVPFGEEAMRDFLDEIKEQHDGELPLSLKGGRCMYIDEKNNMCNLESYHEG